VIVLVLGNVFLGIIVDTFAELRDNKQKSDNDKKNVCFICQLARDKATARHIDFDNHVSTIHNVWNYVDFMTYLLTSNPYTFNKLEFEVLQKFRTNDVTWIPLDEALGKTQDITDKIKHDETPNIDKVVELVKAEELRTKDSTEINLPEENKAEEVNAEENKVEVVDAEENKVEEEENIIDENIVPVEESEAVDINE
jgi:hypothetical protein